MKKIKYEMQNIFSLIIQQNMNYFIYQMDHVMNSELKFGLNSFLI
jgi:hypothetical protein